MTDAIPCTFAFCCNFTMIQEVKFARKEIEEFQELETSEKEKTALLISNVSNELMRADQLSISLYKSSLLL